MATDAYLQIDGIEGESAGSVHQGRIELISTQWDVKSKSATASTAGGYAAGRNLALNKIV